jgi:excisionase family DNA binding protein
MDDRGAFDVSALEKMFEGLAETLTAEQAAELLGITPRTVRSLIGNKTDPLPAFRIGNSWLILRDDFKAWLLRRSNYPTD